jgi:single-strand DNA-binding protein
MNHFIGIGRLTGGAELKYTNNNTPYVKFSICINKVWKKDGERQEKPNFFNCILWGKYGESMQKYLTKGKQVAIEAELEQNTWQDNGGTSHSSVQLTVNELYLLASPRGGNSPVSEGNTEPPPPENGKKNNAPGADDIPF